MEEIARYGAEDVCSSRDSGRLRLTDHPSGRTEPLCIIGANFAVSKSLPFPIPLFINKSGRECNDMSTGLQNS